MTDLENVPLDELWDEIKQRTDAAVLCTVVRLDEHEEERLLLYHGGVAAIGLIHHADARLLKEYDATGRGMDQEGR